MIQNVMANVSPGRIYFQTIISCSIINIKIDTAITMTYRHDNRIFFHQ